MISDSPSHSFEGVPFHLRLGKFSSFQEFQGLSKRHVPLHVHLVPRAPFVLISSPCMCMLASVPSWNGHWFG